MRKEASLSQFNAIRRIPSFGTERNNGCNGSVRTENARAKKAYKVLLFLLTFLHYIPRVRLPQFDGSAGSVRTENANAYTTMQHFASVSEDYETTTISSCKAAIRSQKIRRCCASGGVSLSEWQERKYWRNSSNAWQKRVADTKVPKPRIG